MMTYKTGHERSEYFQIQVLYIVRLVLDTPEVGFCVAAPTSQVLLAIFFPFCTFF